MWGAQIRQDMLVVSKVVIKVEDDGFAETRISLRFLARISTGCTESFLPKVTIYIKMSHICELGHFYKKNADTAFALDPTVDRSIRILDLIALSTEDSKKTAPRWSRKVCKGMFVLKVKLQPRLSFEIMDLHLVLRKESAEAVDTRRSLPALLISFPLVRYCKDHS